MARTSEYYRGKRKKKNRVLIPAAVLLGLISLVVVLFYGMQKYVVITKDSVRVELPILGEMEELTGIAESEQRELEPMAEVSVTFEEPDYSRIEADAGYNLQQMRAIFVKADDFTVDKITEYAARLNVGNALVLEMKPPSGAIKWDSKAWSATAFGLTGSPLTDEMKTQLATLKENKVYLVAQISICRDELYASRSTVVTLRNDAGFNYMDEGGYWLDGYSLDLLDYTVSMVRELYEMGSTAARCPPRRARSTRSAALRAVWRRN